MDPQVQQAQQIAQSPQPSQGQSPDLLSSKLAGTMVQKNFLDFLLTKIAQKAGGEFTSRVKNPDTVVQKIAKKQANGRKYDLNDVNDLYGARIVVDTDKFPEVTKMIDKAGDLGVFDIKKTEVVSDGSHQAHHIDFDSNGVKGEIQIMNAKDELKSVAEHPMYAAIGEKLPKEMKDISVAQAGVIQGMSDDEAHKKALLIQQATQNKKTVDPRLIAGILKK